MTALANARPGYGYPAYVRARAVQLGEGGWTGYAIPAILEREFGVRPREGTVRLWLDAALAERERRRVRMSQRAHRRQVGQRMLVIDDDRKLELLQRLDAEGMGTMAIVRALRVFTGDSLTREQVVYALKVGRYPKRVKAAA